MSDTETILTYLQQLIIDLLEMMKEAEEEARKQKESEEE